jgi:hypothetical protein
VIGAGRRLLSRYQSGGNFARQTTLVVGHFNTVDGLTGCSSRCVVQSSRYSINWARSTYKQMTMMKMVMKTTGTTTTKTTTHTMRARQTRKEEKPISFLHSLQHTCIWTRFEKKN